MKTYQELFEDYSYQRLATEILYSSIQKSQLSPAYLFIGPTGVGQKEIALRFFEGICTEDINDQRTRRLLQSGNHPDLYLIEPTYLNKGTLITKSIAQNEDLNFTVAPQIRIDQIKEMKVFLSKKPIKSELSMIIIDEVDAINESASNAILKAIEEPINGIIILISSRPEKLLGTIKSRCQIIPFKPYNSNILKEKILDYDLKNEANLNSEEIISISNGSPELLRIYIEKLLEIPESIWLKIRRLKDQSTVDSLSLAREISENLNYDLQILLIDWMQQYYWRKTIDSNMIKKLEKLKSQLKSHINSRIAWEITLINLLEIK